MSDKVKNPLDEVLSLFIERYKLSEPYDSAGVTAIKAAIAAGKKADIPALRATLAEYNLYPQFEGRIRALLNSVEVPVSEDEAGEDSSPSPAKSISRMNKAELVEEAEKRNIDPADATVAELREALHEEEE